MLNRIEGYNGKLIEKGRQSFEQILHTTNNETDLEGQEKLSSFAETKYYVIIWCCRDVILCFQCATQP
jgi:hypothetical protein